MSDDRMEPDAGAPAADGACCARSFCTPAASAAPAPAAPAAAGSAVAGDRAGHAASFPALSQESFRAIDRGRLFDVPAATRAPRILLLYGSLRERSYSRMLAEEAARLLDRYGAETRTFDPRSLPLPDAADASHPKAVSYTHLTLPTIYSV